MSNDYIKPIIKWVGGKTQIINKITNSFPTEMNNYHELFLGGGSVLLALLVDIKNNKRTISGKIYAYDINKQLINMYINIQKHPKKLLSSLKKVIDEFNKIEGETINRKPQNKEESITSKESYYYWIRKSYNELIKKDDNNIMCSTYFIFLNKTCFRGVYRVGPNGFNVPYGNYNHPEIINDDHLMQVSKLIKNVIFECLSFEQVFPKLKSDDFIYLDPPYAPEKETSFVGYTAKGFDIEQHKLLFKLCNKTDNKFLMSNADVSLVINSFTNKYSIEKIICKRSINSKKPASKTSEVLIKNY
jgi:DNA adenine methylase